ncbi:hypothetical protein DBR21_17325 [Caulobacter sp. HMWF009]|nr:hypothetical protein DBR21_17325 [Caulobacter sp. HMWF009]
MSGSSFADSLTGDALANQLSGGNGADTLIGGLGDDLLSGGAGNDRLHVAVALDTAQGGEGDDIIQYGFGTGSDLPTITDTVVDGGSGIDTLEFGMVTAALTVNLSVKSSFQSIGFGRLNQVGIENISGGTASDTFTGDSLANVLAGREGADTLSGGAGDDTLLGGLGDDSLDGGGGIDTASYAGASAGVTVSLALTTAQTTGGDGIDTLRSIEVLFGSTFADSLTGAATNDSLNGGGGADTLDGGAGRDTLVGGSGNDLYRLDSSLDVIVESFGAGTDTAIVTGSYTLGTGVSIERLEAVAGTTALNLTGNEYAQVLVGNAGINTLDGKAGADTMIGGAGNDTYLADSAADVITELAGEGLDLVRTTAPIYQLGANLENLTYTGASAFKGTGNALNNVITGGIGVDQLDGGAGADRLIGLAGNDTYIVDNLADVVVEAAGEGLDTVRTAIAAYVLGANVENLTYTGIGNFQGFGNILANVITGGAGNDTLDGKAGADRLVGGLGDDTYFTDSVSDTVVELAGQGQDRILTTLNSAKAADNVETLQYIGTGNFQGYANTTGTSIFGAIGNDTLVGGAGSDLLAGQGGNDQLTGGGGADLFYFDSPLASQGVDRITDFLSGVDHIQLRASTFGVTTIADLGFVAGAAPVAADSRPTLLYDIATGALWFDATGGDNSDQVQIAVLTGRPALTLGDVFVA